MNKISAPVRGFFLFFCGSMATLAVMSIDQPQNVSASSQGDYIPSREEIGEYKDVLNAKLVEDLDEAEFLRQQTMEKLLPTKKGVAIRTAQNNIGRPGVEHWSGVLQHYPFKMDPGWRFDEITTSSNPRSILSGGTAKASFQSKTSREYIHEVLVRDVDLARKPEVWVLVSVDECNWYAFPQEDQEFLVGLSSHKIVLRESDIVVEESK